MKLNKQTLMLKAFSLSKIPMIFFTGADVEEMTNERCIIRIPLNYRTRNHLGTMYFGSLCVGADVAGGLIAWDLIQKSKKKISLVFKSYKADFEKRPDSDVYFVCEYGKEIAAFVKKVSESTERHNLMIPLIAETRKSGKPETVARFEIELSLKLKQ